MELFSDLTSLFERFSYFGILLCLVLGSVGFPFPEDAVIICCGFFIAQRTLSPAPALMAIFAGVLISDLIIFSLGRHFGRRIVTHKWFGRILSAERLALIERRFIAYGTWVILIGRQLFGIRSQVLLMAGITRMPFRSYLISDIPAALVTMAIMITVGYTGGKAFAGGAVIKEMMPAIFTAIIAVVSALIFLIRMRIKARSSESD